jgi:Kef-type K+ transport system membrane component KefB
VPDAHIAIFYEMAVILALTTTIGIVGVLMKQPLLIAFIVAGILAGPAAFDLIRSTSNLNALADIGVAVLLFSIGLKLDMHIIRSLGRVATATGLGQVLFTAAMGFAICLVLGFDALTSAYVAVALTFSSTIIIVKLLTDKREVDSLHGRIAIGFLIVQDIVVVVAMVALSAFGIGTGINSKGLSMPAVLSSSVLLLAGLAVFMRWAAEPLVARIARSPDCL